MRGILNNNSPDGFKHIPVISDFTNPVPCSKIKESDTGSNVVSSNIRGGAHEDGNVFKQYGAI